MTRAQEILAMVDEGKLHGKYHKIMKKHHDKRVAAAQKRFDKHSKTLARHKRAAKYHKDVVDIEN